jgi:hypothetical protein
MIIVVTVLLTALVVAPITFVLAVHFVSDRLPEIIAKLSREELGRLADKTYRVREGQR